MATTAMSHTAPAAGGRSPRRAISVALLDHLAAPGSSPLTCGEIVQGLGARVVSLYPVVDREQGSQERCAAHGFRYRLLITLAGLAQHVTEA